MEKVRVDIIKCMNPVVFWVCWTSILLWMVLSIHNDWGDGPCQYMLDLFGFISFGAIFIMILISFGTASVKKKFLCDIYDGVDKNKKKIILCECLIMLISIIMVTLLNLPWRSYINTFFAHEHRTAYNIMVTFLFLLFLSLSCYIIFLANKSSNLVMENYKGRIITLGTSLILLANLFGIMVLGGINPMFKLCVVICVFHFLYTLCRIVRIR